MSEAEVHAFELNTIDLYNELSELSGLGDVPNNFYAGDDGTMEHTTLPADRKLSSDEFLELNDLLGPDTSFHSEFPAQNNQLYPLAQYTYNGHYNDVTALPASFEASGSMPGIFDVFPPANIGGFATDQAIHLPDPSMQYPFP